MTDDYLLRAARAVQAGRLWRAKEILSGNLKQRGYDPQLYEAYGRLLADMGDLMEAGRFLFLSGAQVPEYREPVQLFLQRYGRHGWQKLVGTFPAAAKRTSLAEYPEAVRDVLEGLGHPAELELEREGEWSPGDPGSIFLVGGAIVFLLVIGAITVVGWIFGWLFS